MFNTHHQSMYFPETKRHNMTDNLSTIAKPEAGCSATEMQQSSGIIQNVFKKIKLS